MNGDGGLLPKSRIPTHSGVILSEEFPKPLEISQVALAAHLGIPVQRVKEIVHGKRGITPDTAWKLAQAFETTPAFWIHLQVHHDLARNRPTEAPSGNVKSELQRASQANRMLVPHPLWRSRVVSL